MCGLAGYAGQGTPDILRRMIDSIAYRGPDAQTTWHDPLNPQALGLGHARLSVIDLAGGNQPMWTADGQVGVIFNGEIYNFRALRAELEKLGCVFQTSHSDTEVLLHGWRTWGERFVERLNGMWAFALLDRAQRVLLLSRDRFGKKPLFYRQHAQGLVFASEVRALRQHPLGRTAVDPQAVRDYLCHGYVPEPGSIWADVRKLPGGCNLVYPLDGGTARVDCWWRFRLEPARQLPPGAAPGSGASHGARDGAGNGAGNGTDPADAVALRAVLRDAVARRLVADVPVGTFLSGGIDSSLVSALAAREHGGRLMTFSIGFDEATFDESAHARLVAGHIGSEHVEERLGVDRALELVDQVLSRMAEPHADSSLVPTWLVSRLARRHVTVALGGDGADELFAGYAPFHALRWAAWAERMPAPVLGLLRGVVGALPVSHGYMSLDFKLKRALSGVGHGPQQWLPRWMMPMSPEQAMALTPGLGPVDAGQLFEADTRAWATGGAADPQHAHVAAALQYFTDQYLRCGILPKVDHASMFNSLEVRSPFLDAEVAAFACRLPQAAKFSGSVGKRLVRQAARGLIPDAVIDRPKQGFAVPIGTWFRQGRLAVDASRLPDLFDRQAVNRLQADHVAGRRDERLALWALLSLTYALNEAGA